MPAKMSPINANRPTSNAYNLGVAKPRSVQSSSRLRLPMIAARSAAATSLCKRGSSC